MYYYIYKDSHGNLQTATSMVFIAKHKQCRAVPTDIIDSSVFETVADFIYEANTSEPSTYANNIINATDLHEIID